MLKDKRYFNIMQSGFYLFDNDLCVYILVTMRAKKREMIHIRLDSDKHQLLKKYAAKDHRSISDTVRMLIDKWLEEKEIKK